MCYPERVNVVNAVTLNYKDLARADVGEMMILM